MRRLLFVLGKSFPFSFHGTFLVRIAASDIELDQFRPSGTWVPHFG